MMNYLKALLLSAILQAAVYAQIDTNSQHYYMYIYFLNSNDQGGARLAFSSDATNWQIYNNEEPVIVPTVGSETLMRDPNTYFDSTTETFHLVWTTGWTGTDIGHATSKDLKTWSSQTAMSVGSKIPDCKCCWAPEIYYDDIQKEYMIYWSTDNGVSGKRTYYTLTSDFSTFTDPVKFFDPGYTVIDATIIKAAAGKYYMFFKDERTAFQAGRQAKNIHYVVGRTPQGGGAPDGYTKGATDTAWSEVSGTITNVGCEGPTAIKIGNEYRVYFDPYQVFANTYRMVSVFNLDTAASPWPMGDTLKTTTSNFYFSHGSISEIPRKYVMYMLFDKALSSDNTDTNTVSTEIPLGKRNRGCGTGVGLAFFPPVFFKIIAHRNRRKKHRRIVHKGFTQ